MVKPFLKMLLCDLIITFHIFAQNLAIQVFFTFESDAILHIKLSFFLIFFFIQFKYKKVSKNYIALSLMKLDLNFFSTRFDKHG